MHDLLDETQQLVASIEAAAVDGINGNYVARISTAMNNIQANIDACPSINMAREKVQRIKELERRLASVLSQSFDDSDTIIGKFKLLESFEGLLSRAIIQDELEKKQINLLELYKTDLKTVAQIF